MKAACFGPACKMFIELINDINAIAFTLPMMLGKINQECCSRQAFTA
jgi:hypothetical protein